MKTTLARLNVTTDNTEPSALGLITCHNALCKAMQRTGCPCRSGESANSGMKCHKSGLKWSSKCGQMEIVTSENHRHQKPDFPLGLLKCQIHMNQCPKDATQLPLLLPTLGTPMVCTLQISTKQCPKHVLNVLCFRPPWGRPWCALCESQHRSNDLSNATRFVPQNEN